VEGANAKAPSPALGSCREFQLIPRLYLNAGIGGFYAEIQDFRGSLVDANMGLE
jgi:hypothetical protein